LDGVRIKRGINAHERQSFDHCLRDQQAVEGIAVMMGQCRQGCRVAHFNGQDEKTVLPDGAVKEDFIRLMQHVFANADLDGDFPVGCRADEFGVGRVFDELARWRSIVHHPTQTTAAYAYPAANSRQILLEVLQMFVILRHNRQRSLTTTETWLRQYAAGRVQGGYGLMIARDDDFCAGLQAFNQIG
jgi:hypothetical protein